MIGNFAQEGGNEVSYFRECPDCHCNLDPGERCSCREEAEARDRELEKALDYTKPQVRFRFDEMKKGA